MIPIGFTKAVISPGITSKITANAQVNLYPPYQLMIHSTDCKEQIYICNIVIGNCSLFGNNSEFHISGLETIKKTNSGLNTIIPINIDGPPILFANNVHVEIHNESHSSVTISAVLWGNKEPNLKANLNIIPSERIKEIENEIISEFRLSRSDMSHPNLHGIAIMAIWKFLDEIFKNSKDIDD